MVVYTKSTSIKEVAKPFAAGYFRSLVPKRCGYGIVVEFRPGDQLDTIWDKITAPQHASILKSICSRIDNFENHLKGIDAP